MSACLLVKNGISFLYFYTWIYNGLKYSIRYINYELFLYIFLFLYNGKLDDYNNLVVHCKLSKIAAAQVLVISIHLV